MSARITSLDVAAAIACGGCFAMVGMGGIDCVARRPHRPGPARPRRGLSRPISGDSTMTTTHQLDQARADLDQAKAELRQAATRAASGGNWSQVQEQHLRAKVLVDGLEDRVRDLTARLAAAEAAQVERDRVEQQEVPRLRAAGAELEESLRGLVAAVTAAEEAMTTLHRRAAEHAELVERHCGELSRLGLAAGVRTDGTPHANGAELRGVRIEGRSWWPPEPAAVLVFAAQRAAAAVIGSHGAVTMRLRVLAGPDAGKLEELLRAPEKPRGRRSRAS